MPNENQNIQRFIEKCRAAALNLTPQRIAVYKALVESKDHPSPESIYQRIKSEFPSISFASVYRILDTLEKKGIITKVTSLHDTLRYDPMTKQHHHIICTKCHRVMDLEDERLNDLKIPEQVLKSNTVINYSVHFNVICSKCRK